jgi:competence protein ComEC
VALQLRPALPAMPEAALAASLAAASAALAGSRRLSAAAGDATRRCRGGSRMLLLIAIIAAGVSGFMYAGWRASLRLADELPPAWEMRDVTVRGIVDDLPHADAAGVRFAFAVERVETPGAVVPHRISLGWFAQRAESGPEAARDDGPPIVRAGERWLLTVRLKRPHGNANPDGFDLEAWLLERNLRATGHVRGSAANLRLATFAGRFGDHVQRARERSRDRIHAALPASPYAGVVAALAIGDQRAISEAQWSVFNRAGVTHLVSISGLHVTAFAVVAGALAYACARRSATVTTRMPARRLAAIAGTACAWAYVLLAGAEVPAVRTVLMLVVATIGLCVARPGTALLVWAWSLAGVLLWDPWAPLAPGFWLSFGAVGLLLYAGAGRPVRPAPDTRSVRWRFALREAARAQWIVTIGLVPGTLALFQQVSLVSVVANAIAIPVVTLGVVPVTLVAIALPFDWPWTVAHAMLAALIRYLEWIVTPAWAVWASHAPRPWTIGVAVAGVLWMLAPRGVPGRAWGAAWLLPMTSIVPLPVADGEAAVTVLDVGQGLAVFIATRRHALVYDTGPRFTDSADAGSRVIAPFLRARGVARLDALVVSHADSDHSGGASSILRSLAVERLVSSLPATHPIVAAANPSTRVTSCEAGEQWRWDGVTFTMLHPGRDDARSGRRKTNDLSCVLRIDAAGRSLLLTGDIEAASETAMLERYPALLAADVLVVPHHGSRTSSTAAFVDRVAPRVAIFTAGYLNRFGHPRTEIVERYRRIGATAWRTDRHGAISMLLSAQPAIGVDAQRTVRRRYWHDPIAQ